MSDGLLEAAQLEGPIQAQRTSQYRRGEFKQQGTKKKKKKGKLT